MQECPLCDAKFPQEATFCWFDGSKLAAPNSEAKPTENLEPQDSSSPTSPTPGQDSLEIDNDPEVLRAKEQANNARLAAEEAMRAAEQADRLAQEAAKKARERAEEKARAAQAALEQARANAEERLQEAKRVEKERQELEAEVATAKEAELQAKREAQEAEEAKRAEDLAAQEVSQRAEEAAQAATAAKHAEEQALQAAKAAAELARKAEEIAQAIQEEAKLAQEAQEKAEQAQVAARERVAHECQTTQVLQQAALQKAIAERDARQAAQLALDAIDNGSTVPLAIQAGLPKEIATTETQENETTALAKTPEVIETADQEISDSTSEETTEFTEPKEEEVQTAAPASTEPANEVVETAPTPNIVHRPALKWEGQSLRQYNILKHLGAGSQGDVFLAQHQTTGDRVALKILNKQTCLDPKGVARFFEYLEKASGLGHPGLIKIHETVHELDAPSFYTMNALNGAPLSSYKPNNLDACLEIATQLAKAMAKAHENKIIHGQLNMENVYLLATSQGKRRVSVLDFGAYQLQSDPSKLTTNDDLKSLGKILENMFSQFEKKPSELSRVIEICLSPEEQTKSKNADDIAKTLQWLMRQKPAPKKVQPPVDVSLGEPLLEDNDDDDDFEITQWKRKSAARKRKAVFSILTIGLAVAAIAYGTQLRWEEAIENLTTEFSPPGVESDNGEQKPQAKSEPAALKANQKTRVEASSLKPQKKKAIKKSRPLKVAKSKVKQAVNVERAAAPAKKSVAEKPVARAPAVAAIKPPSPPPAPLRVEFQSNPAGARVRRVADKKVVGITPFTLQLPSNSRPEQYEFSLPGYSSTAQKWNPKKSNRVLATLKAQAKKVEAKPAPVPQKKASAKPAPEAESNTHEDLVDPFAQEEG